MSSKKTNTTAKNKATSREDRLKQALKANMGRRKAQAKARKEDAGAKADTNNNEGQA